MQLFLDDPDAIYCPSNPPLPECQGWERGFTFLNFGAAHPDRRVKVDVLGPGPLVVHRLVGPDGRILGTEMYGITLEPGGQLEHPGFVYFSRLETALDIADRLGRLDVNWFEGEHPSRDQVEAIHSWWRVAHLQGDVADGTGLAANWPKFNGGGRRGGDDPVQPDPADPVFEPA